MDKINSLLVKLGLGPALNFPKMLQGGQLHRCLLVETNAQRIVLKELNQFVIEKDQFPGNYEESERIANYFRKAGLKAVAAINFDGHFVHELAGSYFMIYPYVEGDVIKAMQVLPEHARHMGRVFAGLHKIGSNLESIHQANFDQHSLGEWEKILALSRTVIDSDLAFRLIKWNQLYEESLPILRNELVLSHRDLHYGNVIWDKFSDAHLIDWESSGAINPYMELIGYSLEWSGILLGRVNTPIFIEIINNYLRIIHKSCSYSKQAFYGWLGHCVLGWLFFNLQRALGLTSQDLSEINRGKAVLNGGLIHCLEYLFHYEVALTNEIREVFEQ
jgi:thiamine kinase-like enzyme